MSRPLSQPLQELRRIIASARSVAASAPGAALAPVTVIVPSPVAGLFVRRVLASHFGLVNVQFVELARVAELLGGPVLAAAGRRPLSALGRERIVRRLLSTHPGVFAAVADHQSTIESVADAVSELRRLPVAQRGRFGARDARCSSLVELTAAYHKAIVERHEPYDVLAAAIGVASNGPTMAGVVVAYCLTSLSALEADFLRALDAQFVEALPVEMASLGYVHMVSAPDAAGEVRAAMGCVAAAVEAGVHLGSVAVLVSASSPWLRLVADELEAAGIPTARRSSLTHAQSIPGRTLLGLLELSAGNFDRIDVAEWLQGGAVREPATGEVIDGAAWAWHAQQAGVTRGPSSWKARLDDRAFMLERRSADAAHEVKRFAHFMSGVMQSARLPGSQNAAGWADKFAALMGDYCTIPITDDGRVAVESALGKLRQLGDEVMVGADAVGVVRRLLESASGRVGSFGHGVFVGTIAEAVGVEFDWVIVVGMVEGAFGRVFPGDGVLPNRERIELGLRAGVSETSAVERGVLAQVLAAASSATVTFGRVDTRAGRPCMPAPFVVDLANACNHGEGLISGLELAHQMSSTAQLEVVPSRIGDLIVDRPAASENELRLRTAHREGFIIDTRQSVVARDAKASESFTEYDGLVGPDGATAVIDGVMSATLLETYAACPRRHFLERVLGLRDSEPLQETEDLSPLDHGSLVHDVLDELFRRGPCPTAFDDPWPDDALEVVPELVDARIARFRRLGRTGERLPMTIKRDDVVRIVRHVLREDDVRRSTERMVQTHSEHGFGSDEIPEVIVPLPDGRQARFRGKIDRIDVSADGTQARVIDYKTGIKESAALVQREMKAGERLQLPLYGLAAHDLYPDAVVSGRYWFVNDAANFSSTDVDAPALGVDALGFVVGELVHGLESGVYPARPGKDAKNCSYCRVVAACDPSRVDQWHTKANDTLLARYVSLVSNIDVSNTDTADTEVE